MVRTGNSDKLLFASVVGLVLFGLIMIHSASAIVATDQFGSPYFFVRRQAIFAGLGLVGMLVAMQVDYRIYNRKWIVYAALGVVTVLLVAVFAFPEINGAHRWIKYGGFQLQPSELAKLASILFLAFWLDRHDDRSDVKRLSLIHI